jgi:tetratricopeptide (TPR) repeat protein
VFLLLLVSRPALPWSWDSADNALPSLREELDHEIATYHQRVENGLGVTERLVVLDRLIGNYQPMGLNVTDLETERARLRLEDSQQALRKSQAQDQSAKLVDKAVFQYRDGKYKEALATITEADHVQPDDKTIQELKRKLDAAAAITPLEEGTEKGSAILKLALTRYLENDPKRSMNAVVYARDKGVTRSEFDRLRRVLITEHPDLENIDVPPGQTLIDHKLQLVLEAIYDGRYVTAVSECTDVLDLEPENVTALTRLGSSYFAMNERDKAKQIWTKALQLDPNNDVLRKFLYGQKGQNRVEAR